MRTKMYKKKYIEVSFLLNNKEVVSKRIFNENLLKSPSKNILYAMKQLGLIPLEIKSVAVECIVISKSVVPISRKYVNSLINNQINKSVEKITV